MAGKKSRRLSDGRIIDLCRDLIESEDFEKVIAERHGIHKDNLTKLKRSDRFKKIYNDVYNSYIAGRVSQ